MSDSFIPTESEIRELARRVFHYANSANGTCCFLHGNGNQGSPFHKYHWIAGWGQLEYIRPEKPKDLNPVFGKDAEGLWLGYLGYEWAFDSLENESGADKGCFFKPEYWIGLGENGLECSENLNEALPDPFTFFPKAELSENLSSFSSVVPDFPEEEYCKVVKQHLHHIAFGDFYEINFCNRHTVNDFNGSMADLWLRLCEESPMPFSFYFRDEEITIASASPERYLYRKGNRIYAEPMKGTRRRVQDEARDRELAEELEKNEKERAENVMIVDLVRNDLSKVALRGSVKVDELFEVRTYSTVHQMTSSVSCECSPDTSSLEVLLATFPMGSMTGAPKVSAMQHIRNSEGRPRGAFSGAGGYVLNGTHFDLNVLIRSFIKYKGGALTYWVGSAITSDCSPEEEWKECLIKAGPLLRALGKSNNHV
jgi:para-aminobenzoate synthetase component I